MGCHKFEKKIASKSHKIPSNIIFFRENGMLYIRSLVQLFMAIMGFFSGLVCREKRVIAVDNDDYGLANKLPDQPCMPRVP